MQPATNPDVVVAGAGMGGLVAALQAQELGAHVLLLEKGSQAGGSVALSGGTVWCARTYEDLRRLVPMGDPELGRVLVDDFSSGVDWLRGTGAALEPLTSRPDRTVFLMTPAAKDFVAAALARFTGRGGVLRVDSAALELTLDSRGAVAGVVVDAPGGRWQQDTRALILATGGFQASPDLRARFFGPWSDRLVLRSNPNSTGDAFLMATARGAAASRGMSSFYGHLLPAPPASVPRHDFIAYSQYHSEYGVLVNLRGERFTDESLGDETSSQAVARQPEARAVLIFDEETYRSQAIRKGGGGSRACDTFQESKALGAPAAVARTVDALAGELESWGFYGQGFRATMRQYDDAVRRGVAAHLPVARADKQKPLAHPPFYAIAVTPGITFTLGGLRIDADARVIGRGGRAIPGLYAVGADAGGIHNERYAGGLCLGLVFGRRAARHAVGYARSRAARG